MPIRPYEETYVGLTPADDKVHHILPEYQQAQAGCPHGVEFWVTIRTVSRDEEPLFLQWCMACRRVEVLSQEEYEWRTRLEELQADDVLDHPDWREESLDRPDRPDCQEPEPDRPDWREPDPA